MVKQPWFFTMVQPYGQPWLTIVNHGGSWDVQKFKVLGAVSLNSIRSMLFNQCSILLGKCVCQLQTVCIYLAFGGKAPDPHRCSPGPHWGLQSPDSLSALCPPYFQTLATPLMPKLNGLVSIEAWTQPAFWKKGGMKIMHVFMKVGERSSAGREWLSHLSTYLHKNRLQYGLRPGLVGW